MRHFPIPCKHQLLILACMRAARLLGPLGPAVRINGVAFQRTSSWVVTAVPQPLHCQPSMSASACRPTLQLVLGQSVDAHTVALCACMLLLEHCRHGQQQQRGAGQGGHWQRSAPGGGGQQRPQAAVGGQQWAQPAIDRAPLPPQSQGCAWRAG